MLDKTPPAATFFVPLSVAFPHSPFTLPVRPPPATTASPPQGYSRIQNLEEYTGLKVIWLEGNGLTKIEGLDAQAELSTLYLQENMIEKMENLSHLTRLNTLNLSQVGVCLSVCDNERVCWGRLPGGVSACVRCSSAMCVSVSAVCSCCCVHLACVFAAPSCPSRACHPPHRIACPASRAWRA